MKNRVEIRAYGKLNLFLSVGGMRPDGKHEVLTVMCRTGVYDTVTVEKSIEGIKLICDDESLPVNEDNLAYQAAQKYFGEAETEPSVKITIEKHIPIKAGMGGGSSDAAAVLSALDKMYGKVPFPTLIGIASSLGADVPFFLYNEPLMLGTGTGADVQPIKSKGFDLYGLFVMHGEKLSTGAAYKALDAAKKGDDKLKDCTPLLASMGKGDKLGVIQNLFNDFEKCTDTFDKIKTDLEKSGCQKVLLCGSGPTVCGIFESEDAAVSAKSSIPYPSFVAKIGV